MPKSKNRNSVYIDFYSELLMYNHFYINFIFKRKFKFPSHEVSEKCMYISSVHSASGAIEGTPSTKVNKDKRSKLVPLRNSLLVLSKLKYCTYIWVYF